MKKFLSFLTLLVAVCSGAWADTTINFSGTVNSSDNNTDGLAVTGGTMKWTGLQGGSNAVTIGNVTYYKMGGDAAYVQLILSDGKFKAGDVVTATVSGKDSSAKDVSLSLKSNSGNKFSVGSASTSATADITYTLTAADIEEDGSIKIFRGGYTNVRVGTFAVTGTRSDVALSPANLSVTSASSVKLAIGSTSTITYTTDSNADVTFTSGSTSIATVSSEGEITAVAAGRTTVTVAQAENDTYEEAATTIEVVVPYAAATGTEFTIGSGTYGFSDSNNAYYFTNGFEMSNGGGKGYGSGSLSGTMKYSAGVVYTIKIPDGVTIYRATVTAKNNYDDKDNNPAANWGTIFGEDLSSEELPWSSETAVSKEFNFSEGKTGTELTVQFGGNQTLAKIELSTIQKTQYDTPTIVAGTDFNFEHKGYEVTITASEGTLKVSTDGTTYTEQTSPYTTYATATTTYYAKTTGNDFNDSEVAELEVANTFDNNKSYVAWVYESSYKNAPNNYSLANDQLYTALGTLYNVVAVDIKDYVSAITDAQKTALTGNLENADLVVISEAVTGKSKGVIALEDIVGQVPVLGMKFFAYSSDRWAWGTPKNADKSIVSVDVSNIYKVFEGVTYTDGTIELFDYPNEQNHIQYVDSWSSEPDDDVVLATTGSKPAMHASNTQKYFGLGLSCDDFTKYNDNAVTIVKNAAAMLIAGEDLCEVVTSLVTVASTGFSTYVNSDYALDFTGTDITPYVIKANDAESVTLEKKTSVAAGEPVLLYADGGATNVSVPAIASADAASGNLLKAGDGTSVNYSDTTPYYVLATVDDVTGFYRANNNPVPVGKAYLDAGTSAGARFFALDLDGETTGIGNLTPTLSEGEGVYYNLNGQRVAQPAKGLYIVNGRKVVIK